MYNLNISNIKLQSLPLLFDVLVLFQEDIEKAVESVCGLMPHHLSEECEDYVEAYGDQVIELLAQEMDPAKVRVS